MQKNLIKLKKDLIKFKKNLNLIIDFLPKRILNLVLM